MLQRGPNRFYVTLISMPVLCRFSVLSVRALNIVGARDLYEAPASKVPHCLA